MEEEEEDKVGVRAGKHTTLLSSSEGTQPEKVWFEAWPPQNGDTVGAMDSGRVGSGVVGEDVGGIVGPEVAGKTRRRERQSGRGPL